jgi:electron transfer flavoprotein alpha subunit
MSSKEKVMDTIIVVAEQRDGAPLRHALELCAAARLFAGNIVAFCWGEGAPQAAGVLGRHGVTRVCDLGGLGDRLAAPSVAAAIGEEVARSAPDAIFLPATYDGRDIAARLSVRIDRPVVTNVIGLERSDGGLISSHAVFGGAEIVRVLVTGQGPAIFVIRAKAFAGEECGGPAPEVEHPSLADLGATDAATVVVRHIEERGGPSLEDAKLVVSGGRGLGSAEHYELIEQLALLLGGAPAASRAIVDAGWAPYANQVGQTGKTVKPEVYLAFGISGAMQHLVGMKGADHIIAVNKDLNAPILQFADLGIVGDVHEVLPRLIEAVRARA